MNRFLGCDIRFQTDPGSWRCLMPHNISSPRFLRYFSPFSKPGLWPGLVPAQVCPAWWWPCKCAVILARLDRAVTPTPLTRGSPAGRGGSFTIHVVNSMSYATCRWPRRRPVTRVPRPWPRMTPLLRAVAGPWLGCAGDARVQASSTETGVLRSLFLARATRLLRPTERAWAEETDGGARGMRPEPARKEGGRGKGGEGGGLGQGTGATAG